MRRGKIAPDAMKRARGARKETRNPSMPISSRGTTAAEYLLTLEGELVPALTIKDSVASPLPYKCFLTCFLSSSPPFWQENLSHGKLFSYYLLQRPCRRFIFLESMFYLDLLKNKGTDVASSDKRIQILDCYSDPPGWKDQLAGSGNFTALPNEALVSSTANVFTEVKHMDKLYNSIIELGKGLVGGGNIRFSIAIDSVILSILFANV
ncbi:hypothetical protein GOBAR_AA26431 [Gossypium barbadense]|uniref:Elongator complex protein 5 n=1 Tax=Gossypium barbadense TaxID=3634 RepID=A0A2P5WT21_GOSBA|nr:hypothetical protein GOBAR_AA26431 [Gossypium barbadense]